MCHMSGGFCWVGQSIKMINLYLYYEKAKMADKSAEDRFLGMEDGEDSNPLKFILNILFKLH